MNKQEILKEVQEACGAAFDFMKEMPEAVLEQYWTMMKWVLKDTRLSSRDKALVAFGAAAAIHCPY
ncbi:MAG: hypothetical protein M0Z58_02650 [Nitrospiraceae bacterium]|nr:hypothetical protein [Nitrospiraceae bacterium]